MHAPSLFRLLPDPADAHPLGRLGLALGLFAALLMMHRNIPLLTAGLVGSVLLLRWMTATWTPLLRAARLLLWLVVPILLLHMLFTPGRLLWPGSGIGITSEGLQLGGWLALRLCALFYAAMLLSRSLSLDEWAYYCLHLPVVGHHLLVYIRLSAAMRALVGRNVARAKVQAKASRGWRNAMSMLRSLTDVFVRVWHGAAQEAEAVWRDWDKHGLPRRPQGGALAGMLLALGGALLPLAVYLHRV